MIIITNERTPYTLQSKRYGQNYNGLGMKVDQPCAQMRVKTALFKTPEAKGRPKTAWCQTAKAEIGVVNMWSSLRAPKTGKH